jgi:hypothetical protein
MFGKFLYSAGINVMNKCISFPVLLRQVTYLHAIPLKHFKSGTLPRALIINLIDKLVADQMPRNLLHFM